MKITRTQYKAAVHSKASRPLVDYKAIFLEQLHYAKLPAPEAEHQFHPTRKWRFDWAWPELKVAVEYQGGTFQDRRTGHSTVKGLSNDYEKLTEAALLGWRVILITSGTVRSGQALQWAERAIK